jgi:hypothetical protein
MPDQHIHAPRGGFVLSLDFELMWGVRDRRTIAGYGANILGVRQVVPRLLDLFARHGLGCTWATVGMLFFDDRDALLAALPEDRPSYADPRLSPYGDLDALGATERDDPYHFGLSMIRQIVQAPHQEIGTHTFSHFYCLEPGQTLAQFRADLAAAGKAAAGLGIRLESIVFPRNQLNPAYLSACREVGLIAHRGPEKARAHTPGPRRSQTLARRATRLLDAYLNLTGAHGHVPVAEDGLTDVPSSRFLRPWEPRLAVFEPLRLHRILSAMRQAAARGEVFHLWFHPHNFGVNQDRNFAALARIAAEAARLREAHGWPSLTMAEAARQARAARQVQVA